MAKSLADRIFAAVKRDGGKPVTLGEVCRRLAIPQGGRKEARNILKDLVRKGKLAQAGSGYLPATSVSKMVGRLVGHPDGFGFVVPEKGRAGDRGEDVYVSAREMAGAMHGDRVEIRVVPGRGGRTSGTSLRILERASASLVGRLVRKHGRWFAEPIDARHGRQVMVRASDVKAAREDDLVQVAITRYPERGEPLQGKVVRHLGDGSDPAMDSALVLADKGVAVPFPPKVLEAAGLLPAAITPRHRRGREDLRRLPTVTIDGESAKDFDDAVSLAVDGEVTTLWVHIADVDRFAPAGATLDQEAENRATSIYLPDMVVPMFPEALSNGLCSLNPRVERCTLTCEMRFDKRGNRTGYRVYESVIKSNARLTYNQVNAMLVDGDQALRGEYADLVPMLEEMGRLAEARMAVRAARGSLDFDLPEAMVVLGEGGEIRDIVHQPRELSHRMIEEFMLIANESVAEWLTHDKWPCAYRVHEKPNAEKISQWVPVARNILGKETHIPDFHEAPPPAELQKLLEKAVGHPAEHVLNALLIRSLMQARYTGEHLMHYGLAAHTYCHFTSPIRRYPDLMVHRLVKHRLKGGNWRDLKWSAHLEGLCAHASERERRAVAIERKVVDMKKARYLAERMGEVFPGVISSVTRWGFFVELAGIGFDGLVPADNLPGRPVFDEQHMALRVSKKKTYRVGDAITVVVLHADPLAGKVTLDPADGSQKRSALATSEKPVKSGPGRKAPGTGPARKAGAPRTRKDGPGKPKRRKSS